MNRQAIPPQPRRRRVLIAGGIFLLLALGWLVHGLVLRELVVRMVPWVAEAAGYTVRLGEVRARLFAPVVMKGVEVSGATGTRLAIREVQFEWSSPLAWGWSSATWIRRVALNGVEGEVVLRGAAMPTEKDRTPTTGQGPGWRWPRVLEVTEAVVKISGTGWSMDGQGLELLLDEESIGSLRLASVRVEAGGRVREFTDLQSVAAWRDGVAYFADLRLDENFTFDNLSVALSEHPAVTVEARACGGYLYADWSEDEMTGTKAALHALNISLAGAAEFAGLDGDMEGTVDLAKLTFNGDPARPLSGQISLRVEAKDFAWRKTAVEELTAGLSVAGRRVRLNEFRLRQKSNAVMLRGTVTVPPDVAAWREAPFEFDVNAEVGNVRAMSGLFGAPWNELSGGLRVEGQGSGKAADGSGWLKLRGWDLAARGIPAGSLQADMKLEGRDLKLTGLDAQSGANFLRGGGQLTLDDSLSYQGRLEMRVREVARYLEPLGRFAPDWAREGGVLLFWDGDGAASAHSGVVTLELVRFTGDLNPVPVNGKLSASYSPGNIYVSRFLLDRGPLSLSSTLYFGEKGLSVQDIELFSGRSRLLRGELFLPLALEAVLARRPWEETVRRERDVYAFVRSDNLDLAALVELFGQETTLRGQADLRLDASGPWENAQIDGRVSVAGLGAAFPALTIPQSRASLAVQVQDRRASIGADWQPEGSGAVTLEAAVPLIGETAEGGWTLVDGGKPWSVQVKIPPTDVSRLAPKIGGAAWDRGLMRGNLQASGTATDPRVEGTVEWKGGRISFPGAWSPLDDVQAKVVWVGTEAVLEDTRMRVGDGTLGVAGRVNYAERGKAAWEILLRGEGLRIYEDDKLRLQAKADVEARGLGEEGEVKGSLDLRGSAVLRGILLTPLLGAAVESAPVTAPMVWDLAPFASWKINVQLGAEELLPVGRGERAGALGLELSLQGILGEPLLLGTLRAEKLAVEFPARGRMTAGGRVHFTKEKPWMPVLDLEGAATAGPYDLRAGFFGPLDERRLLLSSAPPLAAEQLVLLLTTGVAPVPVAQDPAPLTPEGKLQAEPSWLDMERISGLLGWGTETVTKEGAVEQWSLSGEVLSYEWGWK